jgi:hypothetical protein
MHIFFSLNVSYALVDNWYTAEKGIQHKKSVGTMKSSYFIIIKCTVLEQHMSISLCRKTIANWRPHLWYFDTTLCDKVCQWLATGQWFFSGYFGFSTIKIDHHDITEILLKVALNTITN